MRFDYSDEQALLKDSVQRYIEATYPLEPRASHVCAAPFDSQRWHDLAEMGWLLAVVPESHGGFGGPVEAAIIGEQFGRGLVAEPFLGSGVLALALLSACPNDPPVADLLVRAGAGDTILAAAVGETGGRGWIDLCSATVAQRDGGLLLSGTKTLVLGAPHARTFIVSARVDDADGIGIFAVEAHAPGVTVDPMPLVDGTSAGTVRFESVAAVQLADAAHGHAALVAMTEAGVAAIAAESVGIIGKVTELTAEYIGTREQFGAPLSQFQVLRHRLADMVVAGEMARSALHVALAAFEQADVSTRARRFAGVKGWTGETLRRVTGAALQTHGGMGLAEELPVGRFLQRMLVLDAVLGSAEDNWRRAASNA